MKADEPHNTCDTLNPGEGGRTALHVACMRESDYEVRTHLAHWHLCETQSPRKLLKVQVFRQHVTFQFLYLFQNANKVIALLLSYGARTDLLWSGHSPLSLAIATGNDVVNLLFLPGEPSSNHFQMNRTPHLSLLSFLWQAVDDLLIGGANPNIPLGQRVGSALCAVVNIHYHLCRDRAKLVQAYMHAVITFNEYTFE